MSWSVASARKAPPEGRPDERRRDLIRVFRTQPIEEFAGDQIHARPSLFGKVRHHGDAQFQSAQSD
jgi:hypothetical protein